MLAPSKASWPSSKQATRQEREFFMDNLLVRIHYIIVMMRWAGLAPWEFEFPFPGSLTSTFLGYAGTLQSIQALLKASDQATPNTNHLLFFFITLKPRVQ